MSNAKALYNQLSAEQKQRLLWVLSPKGFTFKVKEGFRTVTSDCAFKGLYQEAEDLVMDGVTDGI